MSFSPLVHLHCEPSISLTNISPVTMSQLFSFKMLFMYGSSVVGLFFFKKDFYL